MAVDGRAARAEVARSAHAALEIEPDRNALALLHAQDATRVGELLPIRYGRMTASAFAFYRGAAAVMAHDLAPTPRTGLDVQLCGDAHLLNFGGYASPERRLVFGLNDFDETLQGPFEWDVKRLAASVEIAARDRGLSDAERGTAVLGAVGSYRETMRALAASRNLDVWYARADVTQLAKALDTDQAKQVGRAATRARAAGPRALAKYLDGKQKIVSEPPLIVPVEGAPEEALRNVLRSYLRSLQDDRRRLLESFRFADLARRVVGVGSVGMRCWIVLLLGRDDDDPLFLQLKEAQASVHEQSLGHSSYRSHAQRVVEGQRLSQASSDIFLGWTKVDDGDGVVRDFYVRQMRDWKMTADLQRMGTSGLTVYAQWCGASLARAHARSGDRVAIGAYLGKSDVFDRALAEFATAYADLNERDYAALVTAVKSGAIAATQGV